jgi:hypothetical protein
VQDGRRAIARCSCAAADDDDDDDDHDDRRTYLPDVTP